MTDMADQIIKDVFLANRVAWIGVMVLFIAGGYGAAVSRSLAAIRRHAVHGARDLRAPRSRVFLPLLYVSMNPNSGVVRKLPIQAGIVTLAVFGGLTVAVFVSGKDFSFMGPILWPCRSLPWDWSSRRVIFGFSLGLLFCAAMVALAADSSSTTPRTSCTATARTSTWRRASELFASVALLF